MSCLMLQGLTLDCKSAVGGIKSIRLIQFDLLGTVAPTASAEATITGITPVSSEKFWLWEFREETGNFTEDQKVNSVAGLTHYEQTLTIRLDPVNQSRKAVLYRAGLKNVAIIIEDNNGKYWLMGEQIGAKITDTSQANSGTAFGDDATGFTVTFKAMEPLFAREVASGIIAALTN